MSKILKHTFSDSCGICVYEHSDNYLRGSFFKEKPEVGDFIMSHTKSATNFYFVYEVKEIILNRDANVARECELNNTNAYFKLGLENVTDKASSLGIINGKKEINLISFK